MSGFESPNYTQTPNDLFDSLLPSMGLAELKVILCVIRHTFGYHTNEVKLSIRAIARFTGLTGHSVLDGAKQAEDHGLIERYQDGNKTTLWRAVVSVVPTTTPRDTRYNASVIPSTTLLGLKERKKESKETPNIFKAYESNIGAITPMIADALEDAEKTYPADWIIEVIGLSAQNNKRSWRYCETILKRWQAEGKDDGKGKPVMSTKEQMDAALKQAGYV